MQYIVSYQIFLEQRVRIGRHELDIDARADAALHRIAEDRAQQIREEIKRTLQASVGFLLSKDAFRRFKQRVDYSEYGGAPLLGVKGCVIICHGRSSAKAIKNAIKFAAEFSRQNTAEKIQAQIAELHAREERLAGSLAAGAAVAKGTE